MFFSYAPWKQGDSSSGGTGKGNWPKMGLKVLYEGKIEVIVSKDWNKNISGYIATKLLPQFIFTWATYYFVQQFLYGLVISQNIDHDSWEILILSLLHDKCSYLVLFWNCIRT